MKSIGLNEQQLQQMKTHPGFIAALDQSGGSTPERAASLRNQRRCVVQRGRDVCDRAPDAHPHDYQPRLHTESGLLAPSCSRTPWTGTSRGNLRLTISGT